VSRSVPRRVQQTDQLQQTRELPPSTVLVLDPPRRQLAAAVELDREAKGVCWMVGRSRHDLMFIGIKSCSPQDPLLKEVGSTCSGRGPDAKPPGRRDRVDIDHKASNQPEEPLEEDMARLRTLVLVAAVLAVAAAATTAASARGRAEHDPGLVAVRGFSDLYHDESRAIADGFARTDACVEAPGLGYMGYHYINHHRLDGRLEPGRPEVVLYRDGSDGTRQLAGVEYIVVDADQDLSTDEDRPSVFGHPFDGPMEGHEPGMPIHYDLHVWAWTTNPAGAWSAWNTALSC
jgi:hypothetical protein